MPSEYVAKRDKPQGQENKSLTNFSPLPLLFCLFLSSELFQAVDEGMLSDTLLTASSVWTSTECSFGKNEAWNREKLHSSSTHHGFIFGAQFGQNLKNASIMYVM